MVFRKRNTIFKIPDRFLLIHILLDSFDPIFVYFACKISSVLNVNLTKPLLSLVQWYFVFHKCAIMLKHENVIMSFQHFEGAWLIPVNGLFRYREYPIPSFMYINYRLIIKHIFKIPDRDFY